MWNEKNTFYLLVTGVDVMEQLPHPHGKKKG